MDTIVEFKDVKFSYKKYNDVLNISSLKILKGEKVFIHGPSGSGKSTLLNLISGIISPCTGEVLVLGNRFDDISKKKRDTIRGAHIGYIFQNFNLIPYLSAYENIILPVKSNKHRRQRVSNLEETVNRIAVRLGILSILDKNVQEMSVGQQQRVAVARSFIGNPEIIIADEPTSSLDRDITQEFMDLLLDEHRERKFTLIFVSHDRDLSKKFDRVIPLEQLSGVAQC